MGLTLQIMTKTNCCVEGKDKNVYNENLESETEDDTPSDEGAPALEIISRACNREDKQIIDKINSFHTDIDK